MGRDRECGRCGFRVPAYQESILKFILQRLREPSTWAALTCLGAFFGIDPTKLHAIEGAGVALAGAVAVFLPEGRGE
ncbi:hypothetical protein E5S69_29650 [Cupriavidus necator]|nr:hypothetical protein [Cupriavidus necator]